MRFPLLGGSYQARSIIANCQRCVNYYPEKNRDDAPTPFTYYQRPGLRTRASGPTGAVRLLYRSSDGQGWAVIGNQVFNIGTNWALTAVGTIGTNSTTPCKAIDNGGKILLVDGSTKGYTIDLGTHAFATVVDPTGIFQGANTLAYMDTYVVWNMPNSRLFGSTLSGDITFDALYFASKTGYPDNLVSLIVNRHELVLFGSLKSEIWYNAGNPTFPFAQLPGAYIEHGCAAAYSVASMDIETLWLGQDLQGARVVFALRGYDVRRISNHALEYALSQMADVSDAIAYTLQFQGHYFYVLTFPSGDQTWVYDLELGDKPERAWHQWAWTDSNGSLRRHRGMSGAFINDRFVVGDWENGVIYSLEEDYYHDDLAGATSPISFIKGFPHLFEAPNPQFMGQFYSTDFKQVQHNYFIADMEVGNAPLDSNGNPATVTLRTSRDRGKTFTSEIMQSNGKPGEYKSVVKWPTQGLARDIIFELEHSIDAPAALNGCFVEINQVTSTD